MVMELNEFFIHHSNILAGNTLPCCIPDVSAVVYIEDVEVLVEPQVGLW